MTINFRKIKVLVTDIDGTLTDMERRISISAIKAIRKLEDNGIPVVLITSQAFPIISGLAVYLGTSGPIVTESGGVIGWPWNPVYIAEKTFDAKKLIDIMENLGFRSSYSNVYRYVDFAFHRPEHVDLSDDEIKEILENAGIRNINVYDSGFAVHITPRNVDKASGLLKVLEILKMNLDEVIVVGDGRNDIPMFKVAKYSFAPANAVEEIKQLATIVSDKENGDAVLELADLILSNR